MNSIDLTTHEIVVGKEYDDVVVHVVPKEWIEKHNIDFQDLYDKKYDSKIIEEFESFPTIESIMYYIY